MNPLAIVALVSALVSGFSVYKIQEWRFDAREKDYAEANLESERLANRARTAAGDRVIDSINAASVRAVAARRDADGARDALVSLSLAADSALQRAYLSKDAAINTATSAVFVLKHCGKEYTGLAEIADRHASDVKTLSDAWPR